MRVPLSKWPEVERWLLTALDHPPEERIAFLNGHCPATLRPLVDQLIRGLEQPDSEEAHLLAESRIHDLVSAAAASGDLDSSDTIDDDRTSPWIGTYRLLHQLGYGGMGAVYLCERIMPDGTRRVGALKILRSDLTTDEAILRFRRERVLLAAVDSPWVPRFLDAGTTSDGRPYFVMEHIEGEPIMDWIRKNNPSLKDRLSLIVDACAAVQHLHEQLVIHRDIKPSNVYVSTESGSPRIKLLDFGVSKFLSGERVVDGHSLLSLTRSEAPHTPAFAAPEQRSGNAIGPSTDVYALGILSCLVCRDQQQQNARRFSFCNGSAHGGDDCPLEGLCREAAHEDPLNRPESAARLGKLIYAYQQRMT